MSAKLDPKMKIAGPYFFKICGQVYHYVYNSLQPKTGNVPKYSQLYILDSLEANEIRMSHTANKDVCVPEVNIFVYSYLFHLFFSKIFLRFRYKHPKFTNKGIKIFKIFYY